MKKTNFLLNQSSSKPHRKRAVLILLTTSLILVTGGYVAFGYLDTSPATQDTDDPTATSVKESTSRTNSGKPIVSQDGLTTSDRVPTSTQLTISEVDMKQAAGNITATAVVNSSNGAGDCVFSFTTEDGRPVVKQSRSSGGSDNQKCTISIPEVEFDKLGQWEMVITFYQSGSKISSARLVVIE